MLKIPEIINFQLSEKNRADLKLLLPKMSVFKKKCIYDMIFDSGIKILMDKYPDISGGAINENRVARGIDDIKFDDTNDFKINGM